MIDKYFFQTNNGLLFKNNRENNKNKTPTVWNNKLISALFWSLFYAILYGIALNSLEVQYLRLFCCNIVSNVGLDLFQVASLLA